MNLLKDWTTPTRPTSPRPAGIAVTKLALIGPIEWESAMPLLAAIKVARDRTIEIEVNSDGGHAILALALYEDLVTHPRRVVANIIHASSGAGIAAMGADHRRIDPSSRMLVHGVRTTVRGATADALRTELAELDMIDGHCRDIFADATGQPHHLVDAWLAGETMFSAAEAIAAGLAHERLQDG